MGAIALPIPIFSNGKPVGEYESRKIKGAVLADAKRTADNGDPYNAMAVFLAGCAERIGDIEDRHQIKSLVLNMPYASAEYLIAKIIVDGADDDGIEGMFECPRCYHKIICEETEFEDTRDRFGDLPINAQQEPEEMFDYTLQDIVEIPAMQNEIREVGSVTLRYPTLNDCSKAYLRQGSKDKGRLQFAIYNQALTGINGSEIDARWKNRYGMKMFEQMIRDDIREIGRLVGKYGLDNVVVKKCPNCGKSFEAVLDTRNFFASALRPEG